MGIVIKKGRYVYLAYRSGKKVVHRYMGLLSDPDVVGKLEELARQRNVPEEFSYLFWDTDPEGIDLKKNARYVIERVLEMGGLDALQWAQLIYPTRLIIETMEINRRITPRSKNFWRIWLERDHAF
ncbi:MAG: hypothetical protein HY890_00490 [Deltaproteobacteria bacterium]|nr:hypothetical protein [Deltaproteobacteria bacterium]